MADMSKVPTSALDSIVVDPASNEEDMREVMQEYADQFEQMLRDAIEEGELIFPKAPPRARLDYYIQVTMLEDLNAIINVDDYMKQLREGRAPPPLTPMWRGLAALPDFVWHFFARDFRACLDAHPEEIPAVVEGIRIAQARQMMASMV